MNKRGLFSKLSVLGLSFPTVAPFFSLVNNLFRDAAWHHVAIVFDGTDDFVYLDGELSTGGTAFSYSQWGSSEPT